MVVRLKRFFNAFDKSCYYRFLQDCYRMCMFIFLLEILINCFLNVHVDLFGFLRQDGLTSSLRLLRLYIN